MTNEQEAATERWIKALRSGEYAQATNQLRVNDSYGPIGYCCLGVACDLFQKETGQGKWDGPFFVLRNRQYVTNPPEDVCEYFGLTTDSGTYGSVRDLTLTERNDSGWNFKKIANILKRRPKGLFR